jgi:hypothetical protein
MVAGEVEKRKTVVRVYGRAEGAGRQASGIEA